MQALLLSSLVARFKHAGSSQKLLNDLILIKLKTKSYRKSDAFVVWILRDLFEVIYLHKN